MTNFCNFWECHNLKFFIKKWLYLKTGKENVAKIEQFRAHMFDLCPNEFKLDTK